jgi:hypothetical protein
MLSGWIIGLLFYQLRPWQAIPLTVLTPLTVAGALLPPGTATTTRFLGWCALVAVAALGGFLLVRGVPLRPKKA